MEIKIGTKQILGILHILAWIIFIGVCIEAGGFIFNAFYTLVFNPVGTKYFLNEIDLSSLYRHDAGHFLVVISLMIIAAVMRAIMFYLIIRILHDKKLDMAQPFNKSVERFIFNVSYLALGIGLFSFWGLNYTEWLVSQGVEIPNIQYLRLGGADVWLFMGVTLLVIGHIIKRGVEIQAEHDLTI